MQFAAIIAATLALFAGAAFAKDKTSTVTQTIYKPTLLAEPTTRTVAA
jgi:hypothetical protein